MEVAVLRNFKKKVGAVPNMLFGGNRARPKTRFGRAEKLAFETLEPRLVLNNGPLIISEFMADNETGITDEDGLWSDWIEIYNPTASPVNLDGWYLTDNAADLTQWRFPEILLEPGDYQLVFASNKNHSDPDAELHTNFRLSNDGEYLGLIRPDGLTVSHDFGEQYPPQYDDISYGMGQDITILIPENTDLAYRIPTDTDTILDWTAVDYDDSSWETNDSLQTILITEVGTGNPDYIEIQNVSDSVVDTEGWVVAANVGLGGDINRVDTDVWYLDDTMDAAEVQYRSDQTGQPFFFGSLSWSAGGEGWAMIIDDDGNVVDFVVWHYDAGKIAGMEATVTTNVDGNVEEVVVSGSSAWSGQGMEASSNPPSFRRQGDVDNNDQSDFVRTDDEDMGEQNPEIVLPVFGGGIPGIGYSNLAGGFGGAIRTDVGDQMHDTNASLFTRAVFDSADFGEDFGEFDSLHLMMKYNDGFIAYLNGEKVAQRNAPAAPLWNSNATGSRTPEESIAAETVSISHALDTLQPGANVLTIHGMNVAHDDDDFLLVSELLASKPLGTVRFMVLPTPGQPNEAPMVSETPDFVPPGGMFTEPFLLELLLPPGALNSDIHYTLDGTNPTSESPVYSSPILIDGTTEVRANIIEPAILPGPVAIQSYIKLAANMQDFTSDLPIVIIDSFGGSIPDTSSTTMQNAHMTIFEPVEANGLRSSPVNEPDLQTYIGIRERGNSSSWWPKHHFAIEARNALGADRDIEPLGMPAESDWILMSFYDEDRALMRNPLIYELSNQAGRYAVRWEGRRNGGEALGSGLYLYQLRAGNQAESRKLLLR